MLAWWTVGGGFFTGRYRSLEDPNAASDPGSRFDPNTHQGKAYRQRYWNAPYFNALARIEAVAQKHGLTLAEIALRWISHHSLLKREYGDAVLIGASSVKHIEQVRILIYARGMRREENSDPGLYHRTWLTSRRGRFVSHALHPAERLC